MTDDPESSAPLRLGLRFDLRAAPGGAPHAELYEATLDFAEWGERNFDDVTVTFSEHHASEDGYLPSPLIMAAAVAGRTRQAKILVVALLTPLYDLVRLAEDLAVLDLASGGRVDPVLGAGYRYEEFDMFGVDITKRGKLMEEAVEVLRQAWTGEPFTYRDRTVRVTPRPLRQPHPPITLGGSSDAAARRAARIADGFLPTGAEPFHVYLAELERLGKPMPDLSSLIPLPHVNLVHPDIDEGWKLIGDHCMQDNTTYCGWLQNGRGGSGPYTRVTDLDEDRKSVV